MPEIFSDIPSLLFATTLWLFVSVVIALWTAGLVTDIQRRLWFMSVLDIFCPPLGVVRGMLAWFAAEKVKRARAGA